MLRVASVPVVPTSCADEAKAMERLTTSAVGWNAILRCFATLSGDNLKRTMFNMLQVGLPRHNVRGAPFECRPTPGDERALTLWLASL